MTEQQFNLLLSKMKKFSVSTLTNLPFAGLTTFKSGGTIKLVIYPDTIRKLVKCLRLLDKLNVDHVILGKGSNFLASDYPYDGVAVVTTKIKGVKIKKTAAAALCGTSTASFAKELCKNALSGGEFFACLPASVGGAVTCNAGCYNQEVSQILTEVTAYRKGKIKRIKASCCKFSKRNSLFKNSDYVVLTAKFRFTTSTKEQISASIAEMQQKKRDTQPLDKRSAGSALYHKTAQVSKLIDQAGLKGYSVGDAQVSTKHAGFVINNGAATSEQILSVIRHVKDTLYKKYGITAKTEITLFNFKEEPKDER